MAGRSPGDAGGGWAGDQTNSLARALSRPLTGSLCVCKLPAGEAPGAGRSRAQAGALCSNRGRLQRPDPAQPRHLAPGPGPPRPGAAWGTGGGYGAAARGGGRGGAVEVGGGGGAGKATEARPPPKNLGPAPSWPARGEWGVWGRDTSPQAPSQTKSTSRSGLS